MKNRKQGFTLVELLVVVIIVGILASVALPQFKSMTLRARATEAQNIVGAILTAELLYYQEQTKFVKDATDARANLLVTIPPDSSSWFNYAFSTDATAGAQTGTVTATGNEAVVNGGSVPKTVIVTGTIKSNGTREMATAGL